MTAITFRPYRPTQEERALEALIRGLNADEANIRPLSDDNLTRTLAHLRTLGEDRGLCVVADAGGGELVGYALLFAHWSGEYGGELLLLDELYVVPELRSRGVGADLMAWVEAYARRTGRVGITFVVVGQNTHARRFYERIGYERLDVSVYDKRLG